MTNEPNAAGRRPFAVAAFMRLVRRLSRLFPWRLSAGMAASAAFAAACLLFSGCGGAGGTRPLGVPFGLGLGTDSFSKAVEKDPFPEAAEVNLEL